MICEVLRSNTTIQMVDLRRQHTDPGTVEPRDPRSCSVLADHRMPDDPDGATKTLLVSDGRGML